MIGRFLRSLLAVLSIGERPAGAERRRPLRPVLLSEGRIPGTDRVLWRAWGTR